MASEFTDALKERFAFEQWATPAPRDENVFVWHFVPSNLALAGWTLQHLQLIEPVPAGDVRITDSLWTSGDERAKALHLNSYECASRTEARQQVLGVFADFQGPALERSDDAGELAFVTPKKTTVLFVRGNLVVLLRNGGEKLANVAPLARSIDDQLTATPPKRPGIAMNAGVAKESVSAGRTVALTLPEPAEEESVRIIARGGEVRVEKGRPVYAASAAGEHEIAFVTLRGGAVRAGARTTVRVK